MQEEQTKPETQSPPQEAIEKPVEVAPEAPESNWQYAQDESSAANAVEARFTDVEPVSWTASEYIAHERGARWYMQLGFATAVTSILVFLVTSDIVSAVVIAVIGLAFGVFASRKPDVLSYQLDSQGVRIGQKLYQYGLFKSFAVINDGPFHAIMLMPMQRFMPILTIYFDPQEEDKITGTLGAYLPQEQRELDLIDRLMHRIRF